MSKNLQKKAVILGAGITGLKTALELSNAGYAVIVLEKESSAGGMARSFKYKDYTLDYGPHKFYSQLKGIMPEYNNLLSDECLTIKKKNSLFLFGTYFSFPPNPIQLITHISPLVMIKVIFSYGIALFTSILSKKENLSYEDYFIHGFGRYGYELLFKGLCEKVWGNPQQISEELARRRIPVPHITELVKNMLTRAERPEVSAKYFYYPKKGFGEYTDLLLKEIEQEGGKVIPNVRPTQIISENKKITSIHYEDFNGNTNKIMDVDVLISTIPLQEFVLLFTPQVPTFVLAAVQNLTYRSLVLCYIFMDKSRALNDNWYFYPESMVCFNRVSEQKTFSPFTVPENKTVITAEISCDETSEFFMKTEQAIQEVVVQDLEKTHVLKKEEIKEIVIKKTKQVYPVYSVGFRNNLNKIIKYIHSYENVYTIGRQGLFNYNNADHCIDMANRTAQHILQHGTREEWNEIMIIFDSYKIVD